VLEREQVDQIEHNAGRLTGEEALRVVEALDPDAWPYIVETARRAFFLPSHKTSPRLFWGCAHYRGRARDRRGRGSAPRSRLWQAAAACNSDWNDIMRLGTSIAPLTCDICGAAPCINPSFCRLWRQADAKADRMRPASKIEGLRGLLDNDVSLARASAELNRNRPTPEATIEAVKQAVRARGICALNESQTQERLQRCDADARACLDSWIEKGPSK
jgi:hypothetical protein